MERGNVDIAVKVLLYCENFDALTAALSAYVKAQSRMLDKWAEGDEAVKQSLWRDLHNCEEAGRAALAGAELQR